MLTEAGLMIDTAKVFTKKPNCEKEIEEDEKPKAKPDNR
jgi:hypothetical protein